MTTPPERRFPEQVAELAARLRVAGWEPTAEQLAEALWLARRVHGVGPDDGSTADADRSPEEEAREAASRRHPSPAPSSEQRGEGRNRPAGAAGERSAPVSLYAPDRSGGGPGRGFAVRAPAASALPGLLDYQRALRPLLRYRPPVPPVPGPLDEDASADLSARSTLVQPVFATHVRRQTEIQLLMDASPTTSVWQLTFDSLRQTCEQLGAFRDVRTHYLHRGANGAPMIGASRDREATRLRSADEYRDTTGRRLTLLLSDCVGPIWQDGRAQRLLYRWSTGSPLAVVQPLPPRLWSRTALPGEPGWLHRRRGPGHQVVFAPDDRSVPPSSEARSVPVLLPTTEALGGWAELLGGSGPGSFRGAGAWVLPRHHAMPEPPPVTAQSPRELLDSFRASASPGALELAVHLTAVPLILPLIQLVQEVMLPDTGPMELAEVLLSGLLERLPDHEATAGPRYDFAPGVKELLRQSLGRSAAVLVMKYVSDHVAGRFGKGTRNFAALAVEQLSGRVPEDGPEEFGSEPGGHREAATDELFASVPASVVRWYEPTLAGSGGFEDAEVLLRLWWSQGDPELLHQARDLAEAALAGKPSGTAEDAGPERLVLAQVLHALAGTGEARRRPEYARDVLHRAVALLAEGRDPRSRLELAAVRQDLWEAEGEPGHLLAALQTLRDMAPDADGGTSLPAAAERIRRLRLGRVLLALARAETSHSAEGGTGEGRAQDAVRELRAAADLMTRTGDRELSPALLDLASALRLADAGDDEVLQVLGRAEAAGGEDGPWRLRALEEQAGVLDAAGEWNRAEGAYRSAVSLAGPDTPQRCRLLTDWGEMLLRVPERADRAEAVLREAVTVSPTKGALSARAALLLGRALVRRFRRERFLPDLYEGGHLLEQAAHKAPGAAARAEAWLRLSDARQELSHDDPRTVRAEVTYGRALSESRLVDAQSVTAARALHGRGTLYERWGKPEAALVEYRAAAEEWRLLTEQGVDIPRDEARNTDVRVAALGGTGGAGEGCNDRT